MHVWQFLEAYVLWPDSALDDAFQNIGTTEESLHSAMDIAQAGCRTRSQPVALSNSGK